LRQNIYEIGNATIALKCAVKQAAITTVMEAVTFRAHREDIAMGKTRAAAATSQ
jgi:hypothetical protein